jgi:hypothetical protein
MGCTTMFVIAILGLIFLIACIFWGYTRLVDNFTSNEPVVVQTTAPSEPEYAAANQKLTAVHEAERNDQSITVAFTAADLNALIARHPDFSEMRGKFHVAIADSIMTLEMSVPLHEVDFPRIRDRYLNGTARFGLIYHDGSFNFSLRSVTANDHALSVDLLQRFGDRFNDGFSEGFAKSHRERDAAEFWENVKTLAVVDDKLVVTTKGAETAPAEAADTEAVGEQEPLPSSAPSPQ